MGQDKLDKQQATLDMIDTLRTVGRPRGSKRDTDAMMNDPTARVVSDEEAAELILKEQERNEAARAKLGRNAARKAELRAMTGKLAAFKPGDECVMPYSEYALVYRVARTAGFTLRTQKLPGGQMRVWRDAAEGLL